jgi:L-asparaginase
VDRGTAAVSRVLLVYTGGTIGMRPDAASGGLVPALSGAELVELDPALGGIAELEVLTWGAKPSSALDFADVLDIAGVVRAGAGRPDVDGIVVVQGTDLIEETAFALDLLLDARKPVVVVGAMRAAEEAGSDAAANLRDAVRVAATPEAAGAGVVVVAGDRVHSAVDVVKTHSTALDAFTSPNGGALGTVKEASALPRRRRAPRLPTPPAAAEVVIVAAGLGVAGIEVRLALGAGAAGLVVMAAGSGQTHPGLLAGVADALRSGMPVVVASRCLAGGVNTTYGYAGGGAQWARAGAILAGTLAPAKCRVALALGIGGGLGRDELADVIEDSALSEWG